MRHRLQPRAEDREVARLDLLQPALGSWSPSSALSSIRRFHRPPEPAPAPGGGDREPHSDSASASVALATSAVHEHAVANEDHEVGEGPWRRIRNAPRRHLTLCYALTRPWYGRAPVRAADQFGQMVEAGGSRRRPWVAERSSTPA